MGLLQKKRSTLNLIHSHYIVEIIKSKKALKNEVEVHLSLLLMSSSHNKNVSILGTAIERENDQQNMLELRLIFQTKLLQIPRPSRKLRSMKTISSSSTVHFQHTISIILSLRASSIDR